MNQKSWVKTDFKMEQKSFYPPVQRDTLVLSLLYLFGAGFFMALYVYDISDDALANTLLLFLVASINRMSLQRNWSKENFCGFVFATEFLLVLYLIFLIIFGGQYFYLYKLLLIPAILLSVTQIFFLKRKEVAG